ncbi:MAG: 3-keto-5-aminohexanoate cleavage protein [Anaerolineae bacterium]|nr:3-keto-5-aminohexanoate cleavage protein [Anaerolineae bacterium]NIN94759.1 3-keto-5-aminohexanoate cleavage protein [Anaerolineae bacterium]NIQ77841.1 3-keto-5-aminohexanoate cleavage protein [Anaerolineae bacterium]
MEKVIVTAAVTGSRPTKEMNPAVPYTPEEIAQSAIECHEAGAAVAHIHVRDPETGKPDFKMELFQEVMDRIRSKCDMLVNLTTSGLFRTGPNLIERRLRPVTLRPDICSLDLGSINFPDAVFLNPPEWGRSAAERMREYGIKPEIEVFDVGHIHQASALIEEGLIDGPPYFQLCMGVRWGIEATPENLLFMKSKLPPDARWSVLGVGRTQKRMIALGILLGGNVRVGFEDNIYLREGILAKSNAQLVGMAVDLIRALDRAPATPDEARQILGIDR